MRVNRREHFGPREVHIFCQSSGVKLRVVTILPFLIAFFS